MLQKVCKLPVFLLFVMVFLLFLSSCGLDADLVDISITSGENGHIQREIGGQWEDFLKTSLALEKNVSLHLRAVPYSGYQFAGWEIKGAEYGGEENLKQEEIVVSGFQEGASIHAAFAAEVVKFTLEIHGAGEGEVEVNSNLENLPFTANYLEGTEVTLKGIPGSDWEFTGWTGDLESTEPEITLNMTTDMFLTANFNEIPPENGEDFYSISGYVTDMEDQPLVGISIYFGSGYTAVTTNEEGFWEKAGLTGKVEVSPAEENLSFSPGMISVDGPRENVNFTGIEIEEGQEGIILTEETMVFSRREAENIEKVAPGRNQLFLKEKTLFASQLKPGDVIVIDEPLEDAEYGLLKRITGISEDGRVLEIVPATLAEVIAEGDFSQHRVFSFDEIVESLQKVDGLKILEVDREAKALLFERSFDEEIFGGHGSISGYLKFIHEPEFSLELKYFWKVPYGIDEVVMVFKTGLDSEVKFEVEVDADIDWEGSFVILNAPLPPIPIFLCITLNPYLKLVAGAEAGIAAEFSTGVEYERGYEFGLRKESNDDWEDIGVFEITGDGLEVHEPTLTGSAYARAYGGIEFDLMVGVAYILEGGLSTGIYGNIEGEAEVQLLPDWVWEYGLDFFIDGRLALKMQLLRLAEPEYEFPRADLFRVGLGYGISGNVNQEGDEGLEGVEMKFLGGRSSVITGSNGNWSKHLLTGSQQVTPFKEGYYFEPENRVVTGASSGLNFQAFVDKKELKMEVSGEGVTIPEVGTHDFELGTVVDLVAIPADGWYFSHWTGPGIEDIYSPETSIVMDSDKTVRAIFLEYLELTLEIIGEGSTIPEVGIHKFELGSVVELEAIPAEDWFFGNWIGEVADQKSAETSIFMTEDKAVQAVFIQHIPPELIKIYGGSSTDYFDWEDIEVEYNFWLGKYPLTLPEYIAFCNATGRDYPEIDPADEHWCWDSYGPRRIPAINVSYNDAIEYCNWLSEQEGWEPAYVKDPNKNWVLKDAPENVFGYRLPACIEWEYAARGGEWGKETIFAGSNDLPSVAYYSENSKNQAHIVGGKMPNELGLYDMSGNVWEWTWSLEADNGFLPIPIFSFVHYSRGGSFSDFHYSKIPEDSVFALNYVETDPPSDSRNLGFRLIRTSSSWLKPFSFSEKP